MAQQLHEEDLGAGGCLADGFGFPVFFGFHMEDVVAQLGVGDGFGIASAELMQESHLAIVGMAGARRVETQHQQFGEALHGGVRVGVVVDGIALRPSGLGAVFGRQFAVAGVGGFVGRAAVWNFVLLARALRGLVGLVVGVGVFVAFHSPATMTANPQPSIP